MIITKRTQPNKIISNIEEFIDLLNTEMNDKIINPTSELITYYESIKDSTTTLLKIQGYIKPNCFKSLKNRLSKYYWVVRGYTQQESKDKVSELQKSNSDKVKPKTKEQNPL